MGWQDDPVAPVQSQQAPAWAQDQVLGPSPGTPGGVLTDDRRPWPSDQPAVASSAQPAGFQWSPMSIPGLAMGLWSGIKNAASIPGDVASGKMDLNDPNQATANAGRMLGAAALASPIAPASVGSKFIAPSLDELYRAGGAGFDAWRNSGVEASVPTVTKLAGALKEQLVNGEGILPQSAPRTHAILDQLANPAADAVSAPAGYLDAARKLFVKVGQSPDPVERMAARQAADGLLSGMRGFGPQDVVAGAAALPGAQKELTDAIGNWAAARRSGTLQGLDENAELRALATNSGKNIGNATRQRIAGLVQNPPSSPASPSIASRSGYSPDEIASLEGVVRGSPVANYARSGANFLGGGGGLGRALTTAGGAAAGHLLGVGPEIGGLAGYEAGSMLKGVENAAVQRGLRAVDESVRRRSPLFQGGNGPQQAIFPNVQNALVRALMAQQGQQ